MRVRFVVFVVVFVVVSMLFASLPALGQVETTGRVTGSVLDEEGLPIAGATIVVQSPALQGQRQVETNERGEFLVALLPIGPYLLTISAPGRQTVDVSFRLALAQTVPIQATMKAMPEITEQITVYAPSTRLATTANGENFHMDTRIEELPINDRLIETVANNAPNVVPLEECASCWMQISGARYYDSVVLLDGAEISDPMFGVADAYYVPDALDEVQVQTSGISARYGRFQGGVMNATTKSGGNAPTATARVEYANEDWNSTTPLNEEQADDLEWRVLATTGGYLLKDRLWYFLAGWHEPDSRSTKTVLTGETVTQAREEDRVQAKLRGSAGANHVFDAIYFDRGYVRANAAGSWLGEARAANHDDIDRRLSMLTYQGVLGPGSFVDVQLTRKNRERRVGPDPANGSPFLIIGSGLFNNAQADRTDLLVHENTSASFNLTQLLGGGKAGAHTVEIGGQWVRSKTAGAFADSPTGYTLLSIHPDALILDDEGRPLLHPDGRLHYNLYPGPSFGRWVDIPFDGASEVDYVAVYAQDSWSRGPWRFDLGLRLESYEGNELSGARAFDFSDLSPRIGVTYSPAPDWQLQASWGRYLARLHDDMANVATGVNTAPRIFQIAYLGEPLLDVTSDEIEPLLRDDALWGPVLDYRHPETGTEVLASDVRSPYAEDLNLAVKRALPRGRGTLELRYTHREFERAIDDFVGGDYLNVVEVDPDGDGDPLAVLDQIVWDNAPGIHHEYDAVALMWDYRPGVRWDIGGNYTWADLRGNDHRGSDSWATSGTIIGDYPNCISQTAAAPSGNIKGDVTHRVRAWGNYRFDFGRSGLLSLGGLFRYSSGDVWTRYADVLPWIDDPAAVGDTDWWYEHHFESLGANRFPSTWALDASARHQFRIWKKLNAWVKLSVINVLDRDDVWRYDTSGEALTIPGELHELDGNPVLDGGDPIPVEIPVGWEPGPRFGKPDGPDDYQVPRSYLLTVGASW